MRESNAYAAAVYRLRQAGIQAQMDYSVGMDLPYFGGSVFHSRYAAGAAGVRDIDSSRFRLFVLLFRYVRVLGFLFCFFVMSSALLHIRTLSGKQTDGKHLAMVLCVVQIALIISGLVFYIVQQRKLFMLCCGLALSIYAYIVFSEMLNIAARRYIKTSDYESVRKMAYIDSLCNINNRNAFILEQEASFDCDELCYIVFDLNNLKRINDKYGHAEGDKIIKKAAEIISLSFEDFEKCFRIGGDEFAVIGRYKTLAQIEKALRKFKNHIKEYNSKSNLKLDLAYGYARRENTDISTYELFNKADKEMYRFKRRGKALIKMNA